MAVSPFLQTNFTSGVLDPKLAAREDIVAYFNGLKDGMNLWVMPQGGVTVRPGLRFIRELPRQLSAISFAGATVTAPAGGTAANAIDGNPDTEVITTNNLGTTNPVVVLHVDFGAARQVDAVDIINYRLTNGFLEGEFYVQYSTDNAAWLNYDGAFNWDATKRTRRRRSNDGTVTARYWRFVRIGTTNIGGRAAIGEIKFFTQNSGLSAVRLAGFAYSPSDVYMMAITDKNMDVMVGDVRTGSVPMPFTSAQLPVMNWTQSLDTMICFHRHVRPYRVFRQGGDDEFDGRNMEFTNIPQYDYGAGVGGADEVQILNDGGSVETDDKFTILLDGQRTTTITAGADRAATAAAIQSALRALPDTAADGITVTDDGGVGFKVTFGGDDGKQPWGLLSVSVMTGNSVWSASREVKGEYLGEDIMSDTRGWPRCGLFHARRLHLGGIPGVPDAHLMSSLRGYNDFDINLDTAEKALMFRAQTDQVGAIYNIVIGRHLTLFTNDGEFFYPNAALTDENEPRLTTRSGSKEGLRVFEVDGALMFLQGVRDDKAEREIATSVREFLFVDTEQSYTAGLVSKLSSHLIKNPVDVALRKALNTDDADILLMVNDDGTGTAYTVMRSDTVNAFMPMATRAGDRLLAVGVDKKRRVYFATERYVDGSWRRYLEMMDSECQTDCSGIVRITHTDVVAPVDGAQFYNWDFDNPLTPDAIGVRIDGGRVDPELYEIDMDTKQVTLKNDARQFVKEGSVIRISSMIKEIGGLSHLNRSTVHIVVGGTPQGTKWVNFGFIDFDDWVDQDVEYGYHFDAWAEMMPLRQPDGVTLAGIKVRALTVGLHLYETGAAQVQVNNSETIHDVPLAKTDDAVLDRSTRELLFTGYKEITGLKGITPGAPLRIIRPDPVPFTVLGVSRGIAQ